MAIEATDLIVVERAGVAYKATAAQILGIPFSEPSSGTPSVLGTPPTYVRANIANAVAGSQVSFFRGTGYPAQGAIPAAWAACGAATVGGYPLSPRTGGQRRVLTGISITPGTASHGVILEDRLAHMGGLSGTVLSQASGADLSTLLAGNNLTERIGASNYSDVSWFLEWYTATGATAATITVAVTYDDNSTGNAFVNVLGANGTLPTNVAASRRYEILPAVTGRYIKAVGTIALSVSTGTAGSFGVTAVRRLAISPSPPLAFRTEESRFSRLSGALIPDNACLTFAMLPTTTSTGLVQGQITQDVYTP